jgi:hypothetical protein
MAADQSAPIDGGPLSGDVSKFSGPGECILSVLLFFARYRRQLGASLRQCLVDVGDPPPVLLARLLMFAIAPPVDQGCVKIFLADTPLVEVLLGRTRRSAGRLQKLSLLSLQDSHARLQVISALVSALQRLHQFDPLNLEPCLRLMRDSGQLRGHRPSVRVR